MFSGSIVALITPMDERGQIDLEAVGRLVEWHIDRGTNGLVVAGTTGEGATLSADEFSELVERIVGQVGGRIPVLAGTGGPSTEKTIQQSQGAAELGADGVLVVTPYYNRPTQAGLEAHYRAVAEQAGVPVVLYNVPTRTGVDLLPETVERLAGVPGIVAIKEAVGDMQRVQELVRRCSGSIAVLSGDDPTCLDAMRNGAQGVISVAANVVPARMAWLCRAQADNEQEAWALDAKLQPLYSALGLETNPIPIKWSLYQRGMVGPGIRLPLQPLAEQYRDALAACLDALDIERKND